MSRPPTKWSQNADGRRTAVPARRYTRPMKSEMVYVHQPPFEMKSVMKNQRTTVEISAMNGNRQRACATTVARRIRNSSERCARDQTPNAEPLQDFSQPNQLQAEPTKKPQAITVAKAKMPAATHVPAR